VTEHWAQSGFANTDLDAQLTQLGIQRIIMVGFVATMALTAQLSNAGFVPNRLHTLAKVKLEKVGEAFSITGIELETEAEIPGIEDAKFQEIATDAKQNCPVSKALAGTEIHLSAKLLAPVATR
jgi:hypothetical protein